MLWLATCALIFFYVNSRVSHRLWYIGITVLLEGGHLVTIDGNVHAEVIDEATIAVDNLSYKIITSYATPSNFYLIISRLTITLVCID